MTIKLLAELLLSKGIHLQPCNAEDIKKIEQRTGFTLPEEYLEFLSTMGRGAGIFMLGSSVFLDEIFDLEEGAQEIMNDNNLPPLPSNAFVFWMHQGYQFAFFKVNENSNLDIYFFSEGYNMKDYKLMNSSLADFLYDQLEL